MANAGAWRDRIFGVLRSDGMGDPAPFRALCEQLHQMESRALGPPLRGPEGWREEIWTTASASVPDVLPVVIADERTGAPLRSLCGEIAAIEALAEGSAPHAALAAGGDT